MNGLREFLDTVRQHDGDSRFARLVCVARIAAGKPSCSGAAARPEVVRLAHLDVFREWLQMCLESQCEDLRIFAASKALPLAPVIEEWDHEAHLESLIPADALRAEKALFTADLRAVFAALRVPEKSAAPQRLRLSSEWE